MRNIFLFIGRYFNFLFFLVMQVVSLSMLFRYNKFHQAIFMNAASEVTGRFSEKYNGIEYYFRLKATNDRLVRENQRLRQQLKDNFEGPDSLKRLFTSTVSLDSTSAPQLQKWWYLEAKVVNSTTTLQANYLTIHRGTAQGVEVHSGVISPQGIVGEVVNVSPNFAVVMSALNRQFKAVVKMKNGGDRGTIEWDGSSPLYVTLKDIPKSAGVARGDTVLTSEISQRYPSNIIVGTVSEIIDDKSTNFYTLRIKLATDFSNVEYVYVTENAQAGEQKKLEDSTKIP